MIWRVPIALEVDGKEGERGLAEGTRCKETRGKEAQALPMHGGGGGGAQGCRHPGHPSRPGWRQAFNVPNNQEHRMLAAGWPGQEADGLPGTCDRNWRIWGQGGAQSALAYWLRELGASEAGECLAMTPLPCHALTGSPAPLSPPHVPRTRASRGCTCHWARPATARRGPS